MAWAAVAVATVVLLLVDLRLFAPGREPTLGEGVRWSIGWLLLSLAVAPIVWLLGSSGDAITYVTVYFVERSLSLDNLFVFLLLFAYFAIPEAQRPRLLFWGIVGSLVLRGGAILGGLALLHQVRFVSYVLGATLIFLAFRVARGMEETVDPERSWTTRIARRFGAGPAMVCMIGIMGANVAFAVDSIPAAFAITRDSLLIFMGNAFATLGLRALFVLVEGLIRHFRYLDVTIAAVLGLVGVELLLADVVNIGPAGSFAVVAGCLAVGAVASLIGDRRDPEGAELRRGAHPSGGDRVERPPEGHP